MTNENLQTSTPVKPPIPFGMRLQSAREALRLERKDAAAQLRLSEKIITMMEKDSYPSDLPPTFIRGYMRSYGKLLEISDIDIAEAIEPIKPKPIPEEITTAGKNNAPLTSGNYFMQFFTSLIVITMLGLVGMWWYSHSKSPAPTLTDNQATNLIPITSPDFVTNTQAVTQAINVASAKPENATTAKAPAPVEKSAVKTAAKPKADTEEEADDEITDSTETTGDSAD